MLLLYILSVWIGELNGSLQSLVPKHMLALISSPAKARLSSPEHNVQAGGTQQVPVVVVCITCKIAFCPRLFCGF